MIIITTIFLPHISMNTYTHTHPFNGPLSGTTRVSRYRKGKTNLDFTEATDSEWQWAICKSAPRSRQITMPAPHHSLFYKPDALPAGQPTVSKHSINYSDTQESAQRMRPEGKPEMDHANVASHLGIAFSHVFMSCKQAIAHKTMISLHMQLCMCVKFAKSCQCQPNISRMVYFTGLGSPSLFCTRSQ